MLLFLFFIITIVSLYVLLIWLYRLGFKKYPSYIPLNETAADISATILIPCRNPSQQIYLLLNQLEQQLGNSNQIEVYVIDDFSDKEIIQDSTIRCSLLSLKQNRADLSNTKNNKKEAIALGVECSKHEYIICLDSDVTLSENWWLIISNFIHDKKPKFAAGLHCYITFQSWLNEFLTLEQDILTASSIAALQLRIPTMCNGANMLFSKSAFQEVNGYDDLYHTNGGDDLFLYHRIYKLFPFDTHYIKNLDATVYSKAPETISQLLNQRSRWISKTPNYENKWVNVQGGITFAMNFLCFLSFFFWVLLPVFMIKIMIDLYLVNQIEKGYLITHSLTKKLIFSFIYPVYLLAVVFQKIFNAKG
jgi:biofilm PGA synthesis N-glycosyltransferase PgaC